MFTIRVRPRLKFTITENGIAIGAPGLSAYEVWLAQGNTGTRQDYLDSLKGEKGDAGDTLWEADGLLTIKPMNAKTVDAAHISGEIYGGLFQP